MMLTIYLIGYVITAFVILPPVARTVRDKDAAKGRSYAWDGGDYLFATYLCFAAAFLWPLGVPGAILYRQLKK